MGHASEQLQVSGQISVRTQAMGVCESSLSSLTLFFFKSASVNLAGSLKS